MNSLTAITIILALLLAAHSPAFAQETLPIKIGTNCTFEGPSGEMGASMRFALRIAVGEINAGGGVSGRNIQLVERDDKANPDIGNAIAEELVYQEKVVATIGYCNSGVAAKPLTAISKPGCRFIPVATGTSLTQNLVKYANQADAKRGALFSRSKLATQSNLASHHG